MDVLIDTLIMCHVGFDGACDGEGTWRYQVVMRLNPYALVAGHLTEVTGAERLLLETVLGYQTTHTTVLEYPATETGGSPTQATVATDLNTWCGQVYAAMAAQWHGKRATAFVAAGG